MIDLCNLIHTSRHDPNPTCKYKLPLSEKDNQNHKPQYIHYFFSKFTQVPKGGIINESHVSKKKGMRRKKKKKEL